MTTEPRFDGDPAAHPGSGTRGVAVSPEPASATQEHHPDQTDRPAGGAPPREVERDRYFERYLTFVDAIIAIAVTLLVLPLVEVAGDAENLSVSGLVNEHDDQIFNFFLSFFVIAQMWFAQHRIVRTVVVQDRIVSGCLMAWSLTVVVLPVPTALVGGSSNGDMTEVLYIGTMALSSLFLTIACWRVAGTPAIRDSGEPPDLIASITTTTIMVVAMIMSLIIPGAGYLPLLLLLVSGRVTAYIRSRRKVRAQTTPA